MFLKSLNLNFRPVLISILGISLQTNAQVVTTFAGSGKQGNVNGINTEASFYGPSGVAVDSIGNVYVADYNNYQIRKITPEGLVSTFAGSGASGNNNSTKALSTFRGPYGIALNKKGDIFIADSYNFVIRHIVQNGVFVSTYAGTGIKGKVNNVTSINASFNLPNGVAADDAGNLYVADTYNHLIRKISLTGAVTTFAGSGSAGSADGQGDKASFNFPNGLAVDKSGYIYVADTENNSIRKITPTGLVSTLAGSSVAGKVNGQGSIASFNYPYGVAVDKSGNVFVADAANNLIRKITSDGLVTTVAGNGSSGSLNGIGTAAYFNFPKGIAIDAVGNLYIAESSNKIRKITFDNPSAIQEQDDLSIGMSIFPNPVQDKITINTQVETNYSISLFDLLGNKLYSSEVHGSEFVISTSSLDNGVYLLNINSDKKSFSKKILKVK